jgi:hypothetical protein
MERGKIHLRVSQKEAFRWEVASAAVETSPPANLRYSYYADVVDGSLYRKENTAWNPWAESISWRIVPIETLFPDNYDFSSEVDDWTSADTWRGFNIGFSDIAKAYLASEDESLEADRSIPDWAYKRVDEVISFGYDSDFGEILECIEATSKQRAIEFAFKSLLDEIIVKLN